MGEVADKLEAGDILIGDKFHNEFKTFISLLHRRDKLARKGDDGRADERRLARKEKSSCLYLIL
jgi:hypothetical protein